MTSFNPNTTMPLEEGISLYEARAKQALDAIQHKGFGGADIQRPMLNTQLGPQPYQGHIPPNLPELDDNALGYYMGLLSEWNTYVQHQLAEASVQFTKSKSILEHVEGHLRIVYQNDENDKKRSNPERDDYMTCDRRFVQAKSDLIYWDTIYTSIKAIANSAEQAFSAVSRRITQRGQEIDRGNRHGSVNGHVNLPSGPLFGRPR